MIEEFVKKRIDFNFSGLKLKFDVAQSLFSSFDIDNGTKMLLNSLRKDKDARCGRVLDLGCGYSVIGVFLRKQNPSSEVVCVDRDALAVEFAKRNALLNECNIECFGSLDYSALDKRKFDLIVCNFPAKAGKNALKKFVYDASLHLNANGLFAGVVVKELGDELNSVLSEKKEEIEVVYRENKAGYIVFHLKYRSEISFDDDAYTRNKFDYKIEGTKYGFISAFGLPEFESPSFATLCVRDLLKKCAQVDNVVVWNPGQGFLPLFAWHSLKPKELVLASRDLLALSYSKDNLERNGFGKGVSEEFCFELPDSLGGNLFVFVVDEDESVERVRSDLIRSLERFDCVVFAGREKGVKEVMKKIKVKVLGESHAGKFVGLMVKG